MVYFPPLTLLKSRSPQRAPIQPAISLLRWAGLLCSSGTMGRKEGWDEMGASQFQIKTEKEREQEVSGGNGATNSV